MDAARDRHDDRRWWVLGVVGLAQLMVVVDATVVNVALPDAQRALHFSTDLRQWVIIAYALAFGSLLLLGGRVGDLFGRKWTFIGGALGFAAASAVGGAAQSFAMLVAARATQGVFGAMLAPSSLALLTTTFPDGPDRKRAFGVYRGIMAGGAAVGLVVGGILTQLLSWRYSLFVNLAFAIPAATAGLLLLVTQRPSDRPVLDLPGTMTACGGLFCLVYGLSDAETHSWSATGTIAMLVAAAVLLCVFVAIESRVRHPLLPLRIVAHRARAGSCSAIGILGVGMFGAFLFLTYFLQDTLRYTPIDTGLSFLPMSLAIALSAAMTNVKLLSWLGPRRLVAAGMLAGAAAMAWLAQLIVTSTYATGVLPPLIVFGLAMGSAVFTATYRVDRADAGVASAMVNTMQQIGGAVGTALLSTIFASAVTSYTHARRSTSQASGAAIVHGDTVAFWVSAAIFTAGAILLTAILPSIKATAAETGARVRPRIALDSPRELER